MPKRHESPPLAVSTIVQEDGWKAVDIEGIAARACRLAVEAVGRDSEDMEVCVLACNDRQIAELNEEFRGKAVPTNVIAWPSAPDRPKIPGEAPSLGDIAVAWETCREEAAGFGRNLEHHLLHLILHGCLHLLGLRHDSAPESKKMEELEVKALATIGIPSPYEC